MRTAVDREDDRKYMMGLARLLGVDLEEDDPHDDERVDSAGFTKDYLQRTSLNGLQYIGENNRSIFERVFWVVTFCFGMFTASYFIMELWDKWENSPVFVSIQSTSLPVPQVPFPAVTICSVNKIQEKRLVKTVAKIYQEQDRFDNFDVHEMFKLLDFMIRPKDANVSDPIFSETTDLPTADLLKILKSSMPRCKDMLIHCSFMGVKTECLRLFKVMTTDDGFCCIFNAYDNEDILKPESTLLTDEYSFLNDTTFTKYVCPDGATDCTSGWVGGDFEKWAPEDSLWNPNEPPKPTPGSGPPGPGAGKKRKKRDVTTSGSGVKKVAPMEVPMITYGAGVSMGLDVMLYAEIDKYFMTSAFFEGFKVLIHRPDEFPLVRDKGFALGPGQEMFVAVDAFDVYSTSSVRDLKPNTRKCLFLDESSSLDHFKNYSRSNCLLECTHKFIMKACGCQPYFYPIRGKDMEVCGLSKVGCLSEMAQDWRKLAFPPDEVQKRLDEYGIKCNCPSACDELTYRVETSYAPYPSEMGFKSPVLRKVAEMGNKGFKELREQTSMLHIFFKNEFIIQYKRDVLYGINDFISNIGGLLGLCSGFSLLTAVEIIYWFIIRWSILKLKRKTGLAKVNTDYKNKVDVRETQKQVFKQVFEAPKTARPNKLKKSKKTIE